LYDDTLIITVQNYAVWK